MCSELPSKNSCCSKPLLPRPPKDAVNLVYLCDFQRGKCCFYLQACCGFTLATWQPSVSSHLGWCWAARRLVLCVQAGCWLQEMDFNVHTFVFTWITDKESLFHCTRDFLVGYLWDPPPPCSHWSCLTHLQCAQHWWPLLWLTSDSKNWVYILSWL